MKTKNQGFTLIELMVTISMIGCLASLALPHYMDWLMSAKIENAVKLTKTLKENVDQFYREKQYFPVNNRAAGLPLADKLLSPEVSRIQLSDGAFHISLSKEFNYQIKNGIISIRPVYVADSPKSPISWICGNAPVPKGMTAAGENRTNLSYTMLPIQCRDLSGKMTQKTQ